MVSSIRIWSTVSEFLLSIFSLVFVCLFNSFHLLCISTLYRDKVQSWNWNYVTWLPIRVYFAIEVLSRCALYSGAFHIDSLCLYRELNSIVHMQFLPPKGHTIKTHTRNESLSLFWPKHCKWIAYQLTDFCKCATSYSGLIVCTAFSHDLIQPKTKRNANLLAYFWFVWPTKTCSISFVSFSGIQTFSMAYLHKCLNNTDTCVGR